MFAARTGFGLRSLVGSLLACASAACVGGVRLEGDSSADGGVDGRVDAPDVDARLDDGSLDAREEDATATDDGTADAVPGPRWVLRTASIDDEEPVGAALRGDGNIVVAGSFGVDESHGYWLMSVDPGGRVLGRRVADDLIAEGRDGVRALPDGGLLLMGKTSATDVAGTDAWVARTDRNGTILWQTMLGGSGDESQPSAIANRGGGYTIATVSTSYEDRTDVWLVRLRDDATIEWQTGVGVAGIQAGPAVIEGPDGRLYVTAVSRPPREDDGHLLVLAVEPDGRIAWSRIIRGSGNDGGAVRAADDGGLLLVGQTSNGPIEDCSSWLVRMNVSGEVLWQRAYSGGGCDLAMSAVAAGSGTFIVGGQAEFFEPGTFDYDLWLGRVDGEGRLSGLFVLGTEFGDHGPRGLVPLGDDLVVVGQQGRTTISPSPPGVQDVLVARIGPAGELPEGCGLGRSATFESGEADVEVNDAEAFAYATSGSVVPAEVIFREEEVPFEVLCGE